jgi:DNA-directed RNA polymerase
MLNYILNEWHNENSILFDGLNKKLEILSEDKKIEKDNKIRHNAKYQLYKNIINIASIYRNSEFYLPIFADFRGRLYPLSNYLSYQGNDLARSLILFARGEELNEEGKICLDVYLANLAGYDKISWKNRIEKSNAIVKEITENYLSFLPNNKEEVSLLFDNESESTGELAKYKINEYLSDNK